MRAALRLDDVAATMGGGRVQFGGRVGFDGYLPGELNVTVRGEGMRMRYPEGIRSTVDGDLSVRGNVKAPIVGGTVTVKDAHLEPAGQSDRRPVRFRRRSRIGRPIGRRAGGGPARGDAAVPLRFDIEVHVPSTLRIENNLARLVASADLQLRGTYDRPLLFGRAEVDRGEVTFEARRYLVTHGAIEFTNPLQDRAVLRLRGGDPRARARPDLSGHRARRRHDGAPAAGAQLRSAAAGGRRAGAALQRRAPQPGDAQGRPRSRTSSCARCRIRTSGSATS